MIRFCLPFACVLLWIEGCNSEGHLNPEAIAPVRDGASLGDVIRFEIVDCASRSLTDSPVVSGDATADNRDFLNGLRDSALNTFPDGKWINFGPDSSYQTIRLICQYGEIELSSWHPGAEKNPGIVAASYGLTALEGQSRDDFLRSDDRAYVAKREAFDSIQQQLLSRFKSR